MSRAAYRTVAEILQQAAHEKWPTSAFSARPSAEQHLIDDGNKDEADAYGIPDKDVPRA